MARLGFDPGPVDGIADAETASAIEGYQSFAALRVDGVPSAALLQELRGVTESLGAAEAAPPIEAPPPAGLEEASSEDVTEEVAKEEGEDPAGKRGSGW